MKHFEFEYGHGAMGADLPDSTDVFIPGETVAIRVILDELYAAGVEKKDILLLFSNGLHPRTPVNEARQILGEKLFNEFYWTHQIDSHNSEDYDHLVDLGCTARGDRVIMNKYVFDCDLPILIGHTQGNPYMTMTVTIFGGIRNIDNTLVKAAKVLGANDVDIFFRITLPATVPFIITAVRLGLGAGLTTLLAAESTGAQAGLGMRIRMLASTFESDAMLLYILIIGLIGLILNIVIDFIEGRLTSWAEKREDQ